VAAVLVHIDLDGARPHASSLQALAAGRAVASSWGATLYAAVIVHDPARRTSESVVPGVAAFRLPGEVRVIEAVRTTLARGGADKIVVAKTPVPIEPLWSTLGPAWQAILDHLRARMVVFGADAPSAPELGPRTAALLGARLLLRAHAVPGDHVELRDRDGGHVRAGDSGATVALIGSAPRLAPHSDDDIDVMVLAPASAADPRIELVGSAPAALVHTTGAVIAIGDDAAGDPEIARAAAQLAAALGASVVGSAAAATAGAVASGAVLPPGAALAPALCVTIGVPPVDLAGATSVVQIAAAGGTGGDATLNGPIAPNIAELARALEGR